MCPQPVDLLHKSLEEFQKELIDSGLNSQDIYKLYKKREAGRQGKGPGCVCCCLKLFMFVHDNNSHLLVNWLNCGNVQWVIITVQSA